MKSVLASRRAVRSPEPGAEFWELARECQASVRQLIHDDVPQAQVRRMRDKHPSSSSLAKLAEHQMGRMTTAHVSNLGRFDFEKSYGPVRLESFHFAVGLTLVGTCFWLGAATVDEKLFCTFTYTEPLISAKTAGLLSDAVMAILVGAARVRP